MVDKSTVRSVTGLQKEKQDRMNSAIEKKNARIADLESQLAKAQARITELEDELLYQYEKQAGESL